MKRNWRHLVLNLSVIAAAAMGVQSTWAQCLPAIKAKGVLLSATALMGTKPYVWKDEKTGKYMGYEADLMDQIAKRLGIPKWDYVVTEWPTMIPGLKTGRWDLILSGMAMSQERIQGGGIDFSNPYLMMYDRAVVRSDSPIKTMDDLKGKTIGTPLGTLDAVNADVLLKAGKIGKVMSFNNFNEPFLALANKQVDAVIADQITLLGMQSQMKGLRVVGGPIYYNPKPEWVEAEKKAAYVFGGNAIGVRQECTDLKMAVNKALADMDADGTRKKIFEKYGVWSNEQIKLMK